MQHGLIADVRLPEIATDTSVADACKIRFGAGVGGLPVRPVAAEVADTGRIRFGAGVG